MSEAEVSGTFVQGFVNSAGDVSPVFKRKMETFLAEHGIEEIDPDSWYPLTKFASATSDVENAVGRMTAKVGGRTMVDLVEELDGTQSLAETMKIAEEANKNAFRDFSPESAGHYSYEQTEDGFRIATAGGWEYPEATTTGIIEGFVENATDYEMDDLEETRPQSDEVYAFVISK